MAKKVDVPDYLLKKLDRTQEAIKEKERKAEERNQEQRKEHEEHLLSEKRKEERWEEWFRSRPKEVKQAEAIIRWANEKVFENNELKTKMISLVDNWQEYGYGYMEFYYVYSYFTGHIFSHNRKEIVHIAIFPKESKIKKVYFTSGLFGGSKHEVDVSFPREMVRSLPSSEIDKLYNCIKSGAIWDSLEGEFDRIKKERRF
ncbi:MAG: hypothetical protein Q8R55_03380 [Candidatus Taylorbacteria bacterium]|nr:hypothetical protein [Candidatus Taylorbacteria bacterium]